MTGKAISTKTSRTKKHVDPAVPAFRQDGTVMDLANVTEKDIDFAAMAAGLSKISRFNGIYRCPSYSVAQHCVMGADALAHETGSTLAAGCYLLHDGHEYLLGDWTRPAITLLELWLATIRDCGENPIARAARLAKSHIDAAIYFAAGVPEYPHLLPAIAQQVHDMDERMLRAEGIALFGANASQWLPAADRPAPRLTGAIQPWGPMKAEEAFLDRLTRYLGINARNI